MFPLSHHDDWLRDEYVTQTSQSKPTLGLVLSFLLVVDWASLAPTRIACLRSRLSRKLAELVDLEKAFLLGWRCVTTGPGTGSVLWRSQL